MIVICGVDDFPSGAWTQDLAVRFADRIGADPLLVDGGEAVRHAAAHAGALLFGHAPPRGVSAALRAAPCPVVVAPAGVSAGNWDEVVLGLDGRSRPDAAAATAAALAARLAAPLRVVVLAPERRATGWQLYDGLRHVSQVVEAVTGGTVEVEHELRAGPPADELARAAAERGASLVVVAADPRPSRLDAFRPSFTSELLHQARDLVVVVPPGTPVQWPGDGASASSTRASAVGPTRV